MAYLPGPHPASNRSPQSITPLPRLPFALTQWTLAVVVTISGLWPASEAFAVPGPEPTPPFSSSPEPTKPPSSPPEPEPSPEPVTTLVTHTAVLTPQPLNGTEIEIQVWVAATGTPARDATLHLASSGKAILDPQCTLVQASDVICKLGELDAQGVTVPLLIRTPSRSTAQSIELTATARAEEGTLADGISLSAQSKTTIALARTPKPAASPSSPAPAETTSSPQPVSTPTAPSSPSPVTTPAVPNPVLQTPAPGSPPVASSTAPNSNTLPQVAADPSSVTPLLEENTTVAPPTPLPSTTLLSNPLPPVPTALTAVHSLWLGALLSSVLTTIVLIRRRTSPIGHPAPSPTDGQNRTAGVRRFLRLGSAVQLRGAVVCSVSRRFRRRGSQRRG